ARALGSGRARDARRASGAERAAAEVRRCRWPRGGLLVSRLHRLDAVVADCRRVSRSDGCRARAAAAAAAAGGPRAGLAARPGASAAPSAAAERGERLGGHHAALRLRPVHERALVSREAALRAAACGGDARDVQQSLPSVLGGLARLSAGAALVRLRAEEGAEPGSVP